MWRSYNMRKRRRLKFLAPHPLMVTFFIGPQPTEQSEIHHPFLVGRPWPLSLSLPLKSNLKSGFPLLLCPLPPPPPLPARRPFRQHIKENGKFAFKQQVLFTYFVLRTYVHTLTLSVSIHFPFFLLYTVYCAAILGTILPSLPPWGKTLQPV